MAEKFSSLPEHRIYQEISEFPDTMNPLLLEKWADGIPAFQEASPNEPEWRATPVIPLDLIDIGYGKVLVKNEADRLSNPTGTMKDRTAWEIATLYREFARSLWLKIHGTTSYADQLANQPIPRLSLITAGNEGLAIAECFRKYYLPPPKLIFDINTNPLKLDNLRNHYAEIYLVDLSARALSPENILEISHNPNGVDITSFQPIQPQVVFYDWLAHEIFSNQPDSIYVPYGSGRLVENLLYWQTKSQFNDSAGNRDPRLNRF